MRRSTRVPGLVPGTKLQRAVNGFPNLENPRQHTDAVLRQHHGQWMWGENADEHGIRLITQKQPKH